MTSYGERYRIQKVSNVSGGGNPANPIEYKLPKAKMLLTSVFIGLKLSHAEKKGPTGTRTTTDTGAMKKYGPDNLYKDQKKIYELFEYMQVYVGSERPIDITGDTCLDFITESYGNRLPVDFDYTMIGREKVTEDYRLVKMPWLTIGHGGKVVFLESYNPGDFRVILQYDVDKTGFNQGTQDFPYVINETALFLGGYEVEHQPYDVPRHHHWLSITNHDVEVDNIITSNEIELTNVGAGKLQSIKLVNKVDERTYFESIDLTKNGTSIVPQLPLNVVNTMAPLASDGLYSKPNNVIANFDFKTSSYYNDDWDSTFNTLTLHPNDRIRMRLEPLKTKHTKRESIDTRVIVTKLITDHLQGETDDTVEPRRPTLAD